MKKEEFERLLQEMKDELDEIIEKTEEFETREDIAKYNILLKYYKRLKFIIEGV